ncbi:MAG: DUF131 domain-containing protein [Nitrososphaerota archaeon]|nr:DUF131 domain-containing protein [Nitrososphaerota archaeon]MDG6941512.1 DUF131 domain-containing protein [Nitrososphaerota archaeon]MDG6951053.1 DUF131 domain-containing protein [Nitrososphaerota archaeon]
MIDIVVAGLVLIAAGVVIAFASSFSGASGEGGELKGGAVVMIGPIPLIFGTDAKWTGIAIALAVVLMLVYILGVLR